MNVFPLFTRLDDGGVEEVGSCEFIIKSSTGTKISLRCNL